LPATSVLTIIFDEKGCKQRKICLQPLFLAILCGLLYIFTKSGCK